MNFALAIHVFRKSQAQWLSNLGLILVTAIAYLAWSPSGQDEDMAQLDVIFRCYPMAGSLCLALFAFHFTEGTRRAGFGSFPTRLFVLPISSFQLVAIPMGLGVVTVMAVYLIWSVMILPMVNVRLNVFWPCLFLGAATLGFQALVWSLAKYRTAKLFALGMFGTLMMCSWVLLMEEVATAVVAAISSDLQVEQVVPAFLSSVAFLALGTGFVTVYRQRHQSVSGRGMKSEIRQKLSIRLERFHNFRTPDAALFWHEWRILGRVLPMCVSMLCGFLLVLTLGIGTVTAQATVNVMLILVLSPLGLAAVLGSEYGKPDFWSRGLVPVPYLMTQPVPHAAYVVARVKVVALSTLIAWLISIATMTIWSVLFAHPQVTSWLKTVVFLSYGRVAWITLVGFLMMLGMTVTMRLLCGGMWMTMLGRERVYTLSSFVRGTLGVGLAVGLVFIPDWENRSWLVTGVCFLSGLLCVLGVIHGVMIALSWSRVLALENAATRQFRTLSLATLVFAGFVCYVGMKAFTDVHWLGLFAGQLILWGFPLMACGIGIAARMKGKGVSLGMGLRKGPVLVGTVWSALSLALGISAIRAMPIRADAGGHQLRLLVRGEGKPVVVLEQFGPGPLEPWVRVQNRVAEFATVVSYEHAGGIASDSGPLPRDASTIAKELRAALRNAKLEPPYVLVGHSFGGPYIRVFAGQYPEDVAGLVLVDPTTEEFVDWMQENDPNANQPSAKQRQAQTELAMSRRSLDQAAMAGVPEVPVIVLTGGRQKHNPSALQSMPRWIAAHSNWVARLPDGRHVITTNSGHALPFEEPELVVDLIKRVVERVR